MGNTAIILVARLDPRLHTPMYFFLCHLSFIDAALSTSIIPQLLWNLGGPEKTISYRGCVIQLYVALMLCSTECILLAAMAYDRYAAVCHPLHYTALMHPGLCWWLVGLAWLCGLTNSLVLSTIALVLPRCGHQRVDHFICEVPALIKLACVDTRRSEATVFAFGVLILVMPASLILASYYAITRAVLKIKSGTGRRKAFGTCGSHLTVASLFFETIIYMYMLPHTSSSQEQGKFLTLLYTTVTPVLNPRSTH
ncbi:putative olfactory receptor 2W6 [Ornithorhynchus anatinus]|uniref:putative olfactory receptor 2W6 n=1 Tax=Ornithorhynchus anatinus TaxID=9258 RepID=UPI0010A75149|nr:putative olfactory receptor 2W6 [Ornithorhynchus anatinus]